MYGGRKHYQCTRIHLLNLSGAIRLSPQIFFCTLGIFPLLPFNYSSILLITFIVALTIASFSRFNISRNTLKKSLFFCTCPLIIGVSILYSLNKTIGVQDTIKYIPIFIIPIFMYIGNFSLARWSYLLFSVLFILSNTISTLPLIYDILNTVPESSKGLFNILFHFLKFDVNYEVSQNPMPFFLHKAYISMNIL